MGKVTLRGSKLVALEKPVALFAATILPQHGFVIGLDPEVLQRICKELFAGQDGCETLFRPKRSLGRLSSRLWMRRARQATGG